MLYCKFCLYLFIRPFSIQAYGAKNYMLVGLVYQRALLIVLLAAVPLATVLLFPRPLLVLGGQTIEVAEMTSAYIR